MNNIKKVIVSSMAALSIFVMVPAAANAEWKQDSKGWWYDQGNSWAIGWKEIDGKWYYFYSNGYMAQDCWIGNYYLSTDGFWINGNVTAEQAQQMVNALKSTKYFDGNVEFGPNQYDNYMDKNKQNDYYIFNIYYGVDEADRNVCIRRDNGQAYICTPEQMGGKIYSIEDWYNKYHV